MRKSMSPGIKFVEKMKRKSTKNEHNHADQHLRNNSLLHKYHNFSNFNTLNEDTQKDHGLNVADFKVFGDRMPD